MFSDPKPTLRGKRLAPALLKVTTAVESKTAKDAPMRLDAGTIEDEGPHGPTEKDVRREIFKLANERTATVISPERFAQLWGQLEEIEIFKLPRHRGGIPPQDKPSISLTSGNRTWIVLPPPQDSESFKSLYETWANAKKLIYVYAF